MVKKFRETKLFPVAIPSLKFPFCQRAYQEIKTATVIRVNTILPYILNNFNKNFQKIAFFLFICVYLNKYIAEKRIISQKTALILRINFYIKWKIFTINLLHKWKIKENSVRSDSGFYRKKFTDLRV